MKLVCGNACGWSGAQWFPSVDGVLRLASHVCDAIAGGTLIPGKNIIPAGVCPECYAFTYPELPDRATVGQVRSLLVRLSMEGTVRHCDGVKRPGEKAPGSIGRTLKKAWRTAEQLESLLRQLDSSWLDWKHPNGDRPDFQRLTEAWRQGPATPESVTGKKSRFPQE